jgi:hypothetical protein
MSSRHTLTTRSTFRIVPDSLVFDPALSAAAKEMYAVLLSFAGDTSQAWPGIPGIRERLIARGVQYGHGTRDEVEALIPAERTISGHLAELVERGWVYRRRRMSTSSLTHICQERGEVSPWGSLQQSLPVPAESCSNDPAESRRSVLRNLAGVFLRNLAGVFLRNLAAKRDPVRKKPRGKRNTYPRLTPRRTIPAATTRSKRSGSATQDARNPRLQPRRSPRRSKTERTSTRSSPALSGTPQRLSEVASHPSSLSTQRRGSTKGVGLMSPKVSLRCATMGGRGNCRNAAGQEG